MLFIIVVLFAALPDSLDIPKTLPRVVPARILSMKNSNARPMGFPISSTSKHSHITTPERFSSVSEAQTKIEISKLLSDYEHASQTHVDEHSLKHTEALKILEYIQTINDGEWLERYLRLSRNIEDKDAWDLVIATAMAVTRTKVANEYLKTVEPASRLKMGIVLKQYRQDTNESLYLEDLTNDDFEKLFSYLKVKYRSNNRNWKILAEFTPYLDSLLATNNPTNLAIELLDSLTAVTE